MSHITLRYWAGARAAAGVETDELVVEGPVTLASLKARAVEAHPGLTRILPRCGVLIGERTVSNADAADVIVEPGETVEFLPPFAGG